MRIVSIVEGKGEEGAIPVLLRRILDDHGIYNYNILRPIRASRDKVVKEGELEKAVRLAVRTRKPDVILLILDENGDCAGVLGPSLLERAEERVDCCSVFVNLAVPEYEAWFLAAIESIQGTYGVHDEATFDRDPEELPSAKPSFKDLLEEGANYTETADQEDLTATFSLDEARSAESFDRLYSRLPELLD